MEDMKPEPSIFGYMERLQVLSTGTPTQPQNLKVTHMLPEGFTGATVFQKL